MVGYIRENQTYFYRLAYQYVGDRDLAMDLVQDAVVKALQHWESALDDREALQQAIDRLSPKLKTVVLLRFYEEMQLSEIAEITGTNLSTVKSRLYKGLKKLWESLQEG